VNYQKIILLGGSGFVGRHLAVELAQRGYQVTIPCRRPQRHSALKVLSGISLIEADIMQADKLSELCKGHDVAINLLGILNESRKNDFRRIHIDFVKSVVQACQSQKIKRLLHVSALGADQATGSSNYLRSKGEGENMVHTFGQKELRVTSFQPSVIFGPDDSFINRFASILKLCFGVFPIACADSRFAPVYIEDLVTLMADSIEDKSSWSKRYSVCGPESFTLQQIVQQIAHAIGSRCKIAGLPDSLAKLQAVILQNLPGKLFTLDNFRSLQTPSTCSESSHTCKTSFSAYVKGLSCSYDRRSDYARYRQQLPRK
jgi:uncharacterized protein YbjT (DUF2867 family)